MSRKQSATKVNTFADCPPSDAERTAIGRAAGHVQSREPRVRVRCSQSKAGAIEELGPDHNDHAGWLARLQDVFGTRGTDFAIMQLNRLMSISKTTEGTVDSTTLNALLAFIEGAKPQNEVQAALAVQMAVTSTAAQFILQRATRVDQLAQFDSASNAAVKLLRTFALQAETLAKLQRGGEQIVKVVHVHPGAQAIVGNVVTAVADTPTGGGGSHENFNQPHTKAKLPAPSSIPMSEVWSEDAARQPVPVACDRR